MSGDQPTRIQRLRVRFGLTQARFATALGISQATISRLESGQPEPGALKLLLDDIERDPRRIAAIAAAAAPAEAAQ